MSINKEQLEKTIHDYDLIIRPYIIAYNPDDEKLVKNSIGDNCIYHSNLAIEKGKIFVIDRKQIENEMLSIKI